MPVPHGRGKLRFSDAQMNKTWQYLAMALLGAASCAAQTTQGLISGKLVDRVTGGSIAGATVVCSSELTNFAAVAQSDAGGYYYLPLLSPGFYRVRVTAPAYQSQEVQELELTVAARIELDFQMRPLNDVWESGQYKSVFLPGSKTIVTFFGPDVDPSKSGSFEAQTGRRAALESTVSEVIDSGEINNLPLEGRDVYTMLVTQPGVTSEGATGRGIQLSINGQRPTASNFLLDGVENNNYLTTGPLVIVAPEAIQEYRVSTNNFSAEYGRTSGFLANAVTRSGSDQFHGVGYFYLKNDALNANGFQENLKGSRRNPDKELQPGFVVGGPVLRNRLFFSSAFEYFRSRSFQDPYTFDFPNVPVFFGQAIAGRESRALLTMFPAPAMGGNAFDVQASLRPPVELDRKVAIERLDYNPQGGKDRLMARAIINRTGEPDFIWTPYKDFISPLHHDTIDLGFSHVHSFRPNLTNESRLSYSTDDLHWTRPHPEIPTLVTGGQYFADGFVHTGASLPGSPAFYGYRNVNNSWEFLDNVIWSRGRHLVTAGAGLLLRSSDGFLTAGRDGQYLFQTLLTFAQDRPQYLRAAVDRTALPTIQQPSFDRTFDYRQYFLFAQDTYKVTPRLTANYGLRYEYYGGPQNTGSAKDALVQLGSGSTLAQQIASATLVKPASGDEQLFGSDKKDFAIRAGASYDLFGTGRTLLRGAYGIFYDRPFDNLWQNIRNNNFILPLLIPPTGVFTQRTPIATVLTSFSGQPLSGDFPDVTLVDAGLRNGYAHSYFAGVQHRITDNFTLEVNGLGTYGRRLITTDIVNRQFSVLRSGSQRYNVNLPDVAYRSSEGYSDYNALTAVVRYRTGRGLVQGSYTWSHLIDNQSDALVGDFFDFNFTSTSANPGSQGRASFSQQFNPNADRGNSDFDQRQNLVLFSYWSLPAPFAGSKFATLFRNWTVAELAAFRSGFPFTALGTSREIDGQSYIINNRSNLLDPSQAVLDHPIAVTGGERLLNPAAFGEPAPSTLGNSGRNAFRGPGLYNIDLSVGRAFGLPWIGEGGRLQFRADAFNVLNHANLNTPATVVPTDPMFGVATFGRTGRATGFPALTPFRETARQVQLSVRVEF